MLKSYKRKLILTCAQEKRLNSWIGVCRLVYNMGLEIRMDNYKKLGKSLNRFELFYELKDLRKEYDWIKDVPAQCLQCSLKRLNISYQSFFNGGGFPGFASKKKFRSIKFDQLIKYNGDCFNLPKIGNLKIVKDAPIVGNIKMVNIKKEVTGFFITVVCDNAPEKFQKGIEKIGIDMGISNFYTDSTGISIINPRHFLKYEKQLRIENRSLSRKKIKSKSWYKQARKLALLHYKIGNVRKDFLHKQSTLIAKANNIVYMENLNVSGMSKSNLSKHILDASWSEFRRMLEYKTNVIAVNPAFTSQACFDCGYIHKDNRISQSNFECLACGHKDHADINAAKNIKHQGMMLERKREAIACA